MRGKILKNKKKNLKVLEIFVIFQNFPNSRWQFCSPTNSTSFHIRKLICSFKTAPVAAIPVNPYFRSKSAEHDVTLTSFVAEL